EVGALGPDLGVAIDAGLRRRNAGEGGVLDLRVTVTAVDAELARVVLVAELHRLLARDALLRHVAGAVDQGTEPEQTRDDEERAEDAHPRQRVGAAVEGLRHGLLRTPARVYRGRPRTQGEVVANRLKQSESRADAPRP